MALLLTYVVGVPSSSWNWIPVAAALVNSEVLPLRTVMSTPSQALAEPVYLTLYVHGVSLLFE